MSTYRIIQDNLGVSVVRRRDGRLVFPSQDFDHARDYISNAGKKPEENNDEKGDLKWQCNERESSEGGFTGRWEQCAHHRRHA